MSEDLRGELEALRAQVEELKRSEDKTLEGIEATEAEEPDLDKRPASAVEAEDFERDDPKGDLGASNAALLSEVAQLREEIAGMAETSIKVRRSLRSQGYDV